MPSPLLDVDDVRARAAVTLPPPGRGRTRERLDGLQSLGREDLCLAKVVEPHHDAAAICADLGAVAPRPGSLWEVWAAEPPGTGLTATAVGDGWRLDGEKPFCSGASLATHALVTAAVEPGGPSGLFSVDLGESRPAGAARVEAASWAAGGMAGADTRTVTFDQAPAAAVGAPGGYVDRPGFWHGAVGIAACWLGGAYAVAARLLGAARRRPLDPHGLAHLGAVAAALDRAAGVLRQAADDIDAAGAAEPVSESCRRAESVRASVVAAGEEVLGRCAHALGPGPLALDAGHAHRVADLEVFMLQHHAERDLAALGDLVARGSASW